MKNYKIVAMALTLAGLTVAEPVTLVPRPELNPELVATPIVRRYHVKGVDLARALDEKLASMKMKLNNYSTQSSFVELMGFRLPLQIPRTVVDIDCGTFCPDLGDGYFYLNDINLLRADVSFTGSALSFKFNFEDSGREIKGIHSVLGDNGMPDFNMDHLSLTVQAVPKLTPQSKIGMYFYSPDLDADIKSTGGCHLGGVDLCNKIFGTNRKIQKSVENSSAAALNSSVVQTGVALGIEQYLRQIGVSGQVTSVGVSNGDIVITTR